MTTAPMASASSERFCVELDGAWDGTNCTASVRSNRGAEMTISLALPAELSDSPAFAAPMRDYYRNLMNAWRKTGATMVRDSSAGAYFERHVGPGTVQSLVVREVWQPAGVQANSAYRPFVFDTATGRRLALAGLFRPGVDPLDVIAAAARPLLPPVLDAAPPPHQPGTYPFTVGEWEPGPDGLGFTGGYRAFALSGDALILYMPDAPMAHQETIPRDRFVWSMDGGTVIVEVPLVELSESLRPEYGGRA
ncbi:hypothetical protein H7J34_07730 [Mycolicibacterium alvei]|nr:hypothetical protein [Mycolicibacterium alvei]